MAAGGPTRGGGGRGGSRRKREGDWWGDGELSVTLGGIGWRGISGHGFHGRNRELRD